LAAFSLMSLASISPEDSAKSVIDGGQNNGIDAIYFDRAQKILFIVQSKWSHNGTKTIEKGSVNTFIKGIEDLINARFTRFNSKKIQDKIQDITDAINDAQTKFMLVVAYTGTQGLPNDSERDINDFLDEMNDVSDIMKLVVLRQNEIFKSISSGLNSPIDLEIILFNWAQTKNPYQAFYGQVSAKDISQWWNDHYNRLFEPNIRSFLGNTDANEGIIETINYEPENFWYYNNGITVLCSSIRKKPIGGNMGETAILECKNIAIVNGAQTIGSIARAHQSSSSNLERALVPIRLISLENCPEDFAVQVTKFNNTQNRIDRRDFVALDPEQERIKNELKLEGINYFYKSGESLNQESDEFTLDEATVALACKQPELGLTVRSKDKIGTLWSDIKRAPYKTLFNSSVHGKSIWRLIEIKRLVESILSESLNDEVNRRKKLYATHGNRLILHFVYTHLRQDNYETSTPLSSDRQNFIRNLSRYFLNSLFNEAESLFPDSYPANVCKNLGKCTQLKDRVFWAEDLPSMG
jgi:hypothetical protein